MEAFDLKTVDGALYIDPVAGDLVIAASDAQHIEDVIRSNKGEWKEFPACGVGIMNYLNASLKEQEVEREIKIQLQADGYTVNRCLVKFRNDILDVQTDAIRK